MLDEFESNIEEPQGEPGQAEQLEVEEPDSMAFLDSLEDDREPVEDSAYQSASIPFDADGYNAENDADLPDLLITGFKTFAHAENMTLGLYNRLVSFASGNYSSEAAMRQAFGTFCQKQHIARTMAEKIISFVDGIEKTQAKNIEEVQRFSKAARGRPRNEANAAKIAEVRESHDFKNKGFSLEERAAHKAAVKLLFELCTE